MKKSKGIIAMAAAMVIGGSAAHAHVHPGIQGLNDLLIQKGIITKEEVEAQAKKHSMNITGYMQVQGMITENDDDTTTGRDDGFKIRRAKLAASGYAYEHVKFKLEADFATTPKLDDAFIEDDHLPYLIGRAGQFKVPFSLEMLTSDTEILSIERSEVVNQIAPERDAGISFSGDLADNKVFYSVGVFNGHSPAASSYSVGKYSNAGRNTTNDNDQLLVAGRVTVKPVDWVSLGVNAISSEDPNIDRSAYGLEFQVKNKERGCTLQGEYLWQDGDGKAIDSDGFYIEGGHFFIPKHLEAVVKYEEYNTENDLPTREDDIRWLTLGLNFYIHGNDAKLMANYIFKDEKSDSYDNNTLLAQLQLKF